MAKSGFLTAAAALVTPIAVDAVVDIPVHVRVMEIRRVIAAMATGALEHGVVIRTGVAREANAVRAAVVDRERRVLRVVERGRGAPGRRGVTGRARGREELRLRRVAWIGAVVVIGLMAADASGRQCRVVAVDVAKRASRGRMGAGQREWCVVVIERRIRPQHSVVAQFARRREARVWHRRSGIVEIGLVAVNAQRAVQGIVIVDVAICTRPWRHRVRAQQLEARSSVVKRTVGP